MKCPSDDVWLIAELGEVTVNARAAMEEHRAQCPACRATYERQRRMLSDLSARPALPGSAEGFVDQVMARCTAETGAAAASATPAARARWLPWAGGLVLAAASRMLLLAMRLAGWMPFPCVIALLVLGSVSFGLIAPVAM